ncbi:hypothetical protein PUR34_04595 [Streptomyces sp. JV185]|uniref:hypothetical protein n=1 Tax=Streptomyces sp. JV185 TaxID=858638 RepID=UPI002E765F89|nr:hypothetical protein [Streptomyces sp. JV185]MEE1767476.1 hypothetical protein [Streptomyces sp. JV185]
MGHSTARALTSRWEVIAAFSAAARTSGGRASAWVVEVPLNERWSLAFGGAVGSP